MLPDLSDEQRRLIQEIGLPLPVIDRHTQQGFLLVLVDLMPDPLGGCTAAIPGIEATGAGENAEEALLALQTIL